MVDDSGNMRVLIIMFTWNDPLCLLFTAEMWLRVD